MTDDSALLLPYLEEEGNAAIARGARHTATIGLVSGALIFLLEGAHLIRDVTLPGVFSILCGLYSLGIRALGLRMRLKGALLYVVLLGFVSMPTLLFLTSAFFVEGGVAAYVTGPFTYTYFLTIAVTGFVFDRRLSIASGLVATIGYSLSAILAHRGLALIRVPIPALQQDLVDVKLYLFRALIIGVSGVVIGSLGAHAKRLILRVVHEEGEKRSITRLFGTFVSPEVSERIVREKSVVIGERKTVVVLFADIRSFTALSEGLEPEALVEQLNEYFDYMVSAITKHRGTVDKFIGDAVMGVFGGVLDLDDPCGSAFDAALEMRRALGRLNEARQARGLAPIANGIGMHYGEVMQGTIGSTDRKEFTVIGDAVNTASRIESITKEYGFPILVSDAFWARLDDRRRKQCEHVGMVQLKGKSREVAIRGIHEHHAHDRAPVSAGSSPR